MRLNECKEENTIHIHAVPVKYSSNQSNEEGKFVYSS